MNKYFKTTIGVFISFFFLWLVFKDIDFALLGQQLGKFNWWILLIGLVIWMIGYVIRGWRWQVLIKPIKPISFRTAFEVLVIGFTANNLLPLRAGEVVRALVLGKKENISKMTVFATVAAERLFDGIVIVGFTLLGARSVVLVPWMQQAIWIAIWIFFIALIGFVALIFYKQLALRIVAVCIGPLPQNVQKKLHELLNVFIMGIEFLKNPSTLLAVFCSSIIIWLSEAFFYYLAGMSFGFDITFSHALLIKGILNLGILIPSGPGYVGTFEFLVVETLKLFAIDPTAALGYAIVSHFVEFVSINVLGIFYWVRYGVKLTEISPKENTLNV